MESLISVLFFTVLAAIPVLRFYGFIGFPSRTVLLPFQGGLLFRRGRPIRELGPGRHWVFVAVGKILFLDKRPIQVNVESCAVALADGGDAFYSFSASAKVCDVRQAIYAAVNYVQIPSFVTLSVTRAILSRCHGSQLALGRAAVEDEISEGCRARLLAAGFELVSFRLTELDFDSESADLD